MRVCNRAHAGWLERADIPRETPRAQRTSAHTRRFRVEDARWLLPFSAGKQQILDLRVTATCQMKHPAAALRERASLLIWINVSGSTDTTAGPLGESWRIGIRQQRQNLIGELPKRFGRVHTLLFVRTALRDRAMSKQRR